MFLFVTIFTRLNTMGSLNYESIIPYNILLAATNTDFYVILTLVFYSDI